MIKILRKEDLQKTMEQQEIFIQSTLDGSMQPSLFYKSESKEKRPLLVGLHTWSFNRFNQIGNMLPLCEKYNFNLLLPEFRGSNLDSNPNCHQACGSDLAKHDIKHYPDIITAADKSKNETPYYTNSSHLPVGYTDDIFAALDIQDELQTLYTSGTVFHAFLGEKLPTWKSAAALIRKIAENYKLPYYTLSPTYSVCKNHGYISGEQYTCPECGESTEVYSRITGYYRPVQNWNDGKSQEFEHRIEYNPEKFDKELSKIKAEVAQCDDCGVESENKVILFASATCPNCKMAAMFLDKAGIAYEKVMADENKELAEEFGVHQAPTLINIVDGKAEKIVNLSNIRAFTER